MKRSEVKEKNRNAVEKVLHCQFCIFKTNKVVNLWISFHSEKDLEPPTHDVTRVGGTLWWVSQMFRS